MPDCQCLECLEGRARRSVVLAWAAMWEMELEAAHG